MHRVVLDANIWVSALLNQHGPPAATVRLLASGIHRVLVSAPLLAEVQDVLSRPRLVKRHGLDASGVARVVSLMAAASEIVTPIESRIALRDPDDEVVLSAAIGGQATHVVTGDADLLEDPSVLSATRKRGIDIVSPRDFVELLEKDL